MLNKELALIIAKIIKNLGLDKVDVEGFEFRFIIQKVGYVVQKIGCDLGLKFGWYSLGPYSRTLQNYYSVIADILSEESSGDQGVKKGLDKDTERCVEKTLDFLNDYKEYVGELDIRSLEVLASLMMLCTEIYPKPSNPLEELLKRKKGIPLDLAVKTQRFLVDKNICALL
jgi:uncharacterized protein YwgA